MERLGLNISPRPASGFVHYHKVILHAKKRLLAELLKPDQTTLVDIVLRRVVRRGIFELKNSDRIDPKGEDFSKQPLGKPIP